MSSKAIFICSPWTGVKHVQPKNLKTSMKYSCKKHINIHKKYMKRNIKANIKWNRMDRQTINTI